MRLFLSAVAVALSVQGCTLFVPNDPYGQFPDNYKTLATDYVMAREPEPKYKNLKLKILNISSPEKTTISNAFHAGYLVRVDFTFDNKLADAATNERLEASARTQWGLLIHNGVIIETSGTPTAPKP